MKWDIQQQIDEEFGGMTPDAARAAQRRRIEGDPALAEFLARVHAANVPVPSTGEEGEESPQPTRPLA